MFGVGGEGEMSWSNTTLVVACLLFAASIVWKYRPLGGLRRLPQRWMFPGPSDTSKLAEDVKVARARVRLAKNPRERSDALVATARLAARDPRHLTAAMGLLLRAM